MSPTGRYGWEGRVFEQVRRQRKHGRWVKSWYVQLMRYDIRALAWNTLTARGGFKSEAEVHAWCAAVRRLS